MPYRPLVCKIRCSNPNKKGSKFANRNYLIYIATRENVDLGNEQHADPLKEDLAADQETANEDYLKYISDRPRSHGLFGNIDTQDLTALSNKVSDLTEQGRNIYKVIISLSETDAQLLGYTNKEKWNEYLKASMPDLAKSLGVSVYDHTWVAAYHAENGHPHVHVMLWDNKDKVKSPFIPVATQHECRKILSDKMFDEEYENSLKQILKTEREEYINQKNAARDDITAEFKKIFFSVQPINGNDTLGLPDKLHTGELEHITQALEEIKDLLPVSGKMMYKYMPAEIKEKIDAITDKILERKDFNVKVQEYVHATVELQRMQGKVEKQLVYAEQRAMGELHSRAGNILLKGMMLQMQRTSSMTDREMQNDMSKIWEASDTEIEVLDQTMDVTGFETEYYTEGHMKKRTNMYQQAKACLEEKDYVKAMELFEKCAKKGHGFAMYQIGKMYMKGMGVAKDTIKAISWFEEASKNRASVAADYMLGKLYSREEDILDIEKSIKYFTTAAENGNATAMYQLGNIFYSGKFVEKDQELGLQWMLKASQEGDAYSSVFLGDLSMQNSKKAGDDSFLKAVNYYGIACQKEHLTAMYKLGKIYCKGDCGSDKIPEGEKML